MSRLGLCTLLLSPLAVVACGGILTPVSPSAISATSQLPGAAPDGGISAPRSQVIRGSVGPLGADNPPCWADRYPCTVFDFATAQDGPIEVVLTWDGAPRALMVQLYWAGEGLAHEDVAPVNGPARIAFLRPRMEAAAYRLRIVSREPASEIPFTLVVRW